MVANRSGGPATVAQAPHQVFPRLGHKRQHRLVAPLAFVLRIVALASAHLLAVQGPARLILRGDQNFRGARSGSSYALLEK